MTTKTKEQEREELQELKLAELENRIAEAEKSLIALTGQLIILGTQRLTVVQKGKQRLGGNHKAKRVLDKTTGITYDSLSKAGFALAEEFGVEKTNFAWYEIQKSNPERFEVIG